nr:hypothetical protein [Mucilaginibacter sp. FT3.2]
MDKIKLRMDNYLAVFPRHQDNKIRIIYVIPDRGFTVKSKITLIAPINLQSVADINTSTCTQCA